MPVLAFVGKRCPQDRKIQEASFRRGAHLTKIIASTRLIENADCPVQVLACLLALLGCQVRLAQIDACVAHLKTRLRQIKLLCIDALQQQRKHDINSST